MKQKRTKPLPMVCNHCRYVWNTRSTMLFVSCPRCGGKVRVTENETGPTS